MNTSKSNCGICKYPGSDLRFLGCGCSINAVSYIFAPIDVKDRHSLSTTTLQEAVVDPKIRIWRSDPDPNFFRYRYKSRSASRWIAVFATKYPISENTNSEFFYRTFSTYHSHLILFLNFWTVLCNNDNTRKHNRDVSL